MKNKLALAGASVVAAGSTVLATPPDPLTEINTALTGIEGVWGSVKAIMIGVAIVVVALRFFRKAK